MARDAATLAPVDELVAMLAELPDPVAVTMDPEDVHVPGCWLALDEVRPHTVGGQLELRCSLFLIGPDTGAHRGLAHALELYNRVTAAGVIPDGPVVTQGVVLPATPTPLPALRVPLYLYT